MISEPLDNGNKNFLPSSIQIATIDVGNTAANIIPEMAKATVNIRYNDLHNSKSLTEWMQKHINDVFDKIDKASCVFEVEANGESF